MGKVPPDFQIGKEADEAQTNSPQTLGFIVGRGHSLQSILNSRRLIGMNLLSRQEQASPPRHPERSESHHCHSGANKVNPATVILSEGRSP